MKFKLSNHLLLCLLFGIPVYWTALYYIELAVNRELEELAVAATIGFFGFLYVGRYAAQLFATPEKTISNTWLLILGGIPPVCLIWLFVHADFPLITSPALNLLLYWLPFMVLSLTLGTFIKLIRINQQRLGEARAGEAHSQSELRLLQSQLSPHFLFNTLNNLYGISISRHQDMPGLLLKLSELLRYSVYDAKEQFVPLEDEIAYINNYLAFEKIRIGGRLKLQTDFQGLEEGTLIAPMLLIIFIENAFKHAKNSIEDLIFVDIKLKTWSGFIQFEIRNSHHVGEENVMKGKHSGFGLENVKKRLDLLYYNQYDLKFANSSGFYTVMLQLSKKTK